MNFLCHIEAVNLDNLFSDCQDLSTTRGGGLGVLNIAQRVQKDLGGNLISFGASQGLLEIAGDSAEEVERRIRSVLAGIRMLNHATIMISVRPNGGDYRQTRAELKAANRWRQMQSPSVIYPKLQANLVCDIDHVRPAIARHDLPDKKNQSDFTYERRQLGREEKHELLSRLLTGITTGPLEAVSDLEELSWLEAAGNLNEKIAVLRFDGNDFGGIGESCSGKDEQTVFSETTHRHHDEFFRELLKIKPEAWLIPADTQRSTRVRLEIVVYGGDEITLITPAWLGWRALKRFYELAASWPPLDLGGGDIKMTYSAGVVFCHHNAPIHAVKALTSSLADQAKDRARQSDRAGKNKGNYAVYQVLESFDSIGRNIDDFMEERYRFASPDAILLSLPDIAAFEQHMPEWRETLSRRKLHEIVENLTRGVVPDDLNAAISDLVQQRANGVDDHASNLKDLCSRLGPAALLHILELWDYAGVEI